MIFTRKAQFVLGSVAAFALAPLVPAMLFAGFVLVQYRIGAPEISVPFDIITSVYITNVYIIALVHAILFGVPVFGINRQTARHPLKASMLGAAWIGAIPISIVALFAYFDTAYSRVSTETYVPYLKTLEGWMQYFALVAMAGALGASAGLAFWAILKASGNLEAARGNYDPAQPGKILPTLVIVVMASVTVFCVFQIYARP